MFINESVEENLRFLIFEVQKQLERTAEYICEPKLELLDSILSRDDYIDNLKTNIQRKCFSSVSSLNNGGAARAESLKAIVIVAANLEKIADFCEKSIRQLTYIEHEDILKKYDFAELFEQVRYGVSLIEDVILNDEATMAITLCRVEHRIDELYGEMFKLILVDLSRGEKTQSLVTTLFIARYIERMGDSLLNIGEAAMSAFLGERIKIDQFDALEETLSEADFNPQITDLSLTAMGETNSGCRIDLVSSRNENSNATMVIFKEGRREKLQREKAGVDYWDAMMPGIAPAIYAHHQDGDTGAILFEYLNGSTFEKILLNGDAYELNTALTHLTETLRADWRKTQQKTAAPVDFVQQIRSRLGDIYAVHPEFTAQQGVLGGVVIPSFEDLLSMAEVMEKELHVPFQVLVHGDFNIDNVIFDPKTKRVRFIDLHRAAMKDYVQDVSVFLVSNFRLQIFDPPIRERINQTIRDFKGFASDFALEVGDKTFERRLALGIARSFVTSTRFVLDEAFAQDMLMRSRFLLEGLTANTGRRVVKYKLPEEVLIG